MRLYVDLDETLIANVVRGNDVVDILPRPGVGWFLRTLAQHGDLWLLTAAHSSHAERALKKIGIGAKRFKGILTREDLEPVQEQIAVVLETPGLTDDQRLALWNDIKPIANPGIMFDDFPVGSPMWAMKSKAIGISEQEDKWIQVEPYYPGKLDRQGLKNAYSEFVARFGDQGLGLGRRVMVSNS